MDPVAIYDIETEDWTKFVLGVIYYPKTKETNVYHWEGGNGERRMAMDLLEIDGDIVAHNGGRFDHLWFLDCLAANDLVRPGDIISNGQGIVSLKIGKACFVDSLKVYPMSLERLTNGAKHDISNLCNCGTDCGGYCAIRRDMAAGTRSRIAAYCIADCVELGKALEEMRNVACEAGITLGRTLGSTSWKSAKEALNLPNAEFATSDWQNIRKGYYGGRVEVFRTKSKAGFACDVNSMYPFCLATTQLPIDFIGCSNGKGARNDWVKGYPGIYTVTIRVPEMFIPPLPVRSEAGLSFPFGVFSGTWPRPELEYALSLGCRIERVLSSAAFASEQLIFGPWVERMFAERMKYGKKTREGVWLKFIANSLTGKLGSRSERIAIKVWPDFNSLRICECEDFTKCTCSAFRPMDSKGRMWQSVIALEKVEGCAHVEWAAYLTSMSRIKLHKQLIDGGKNDATYCDTDSCWSECERNKDIGTALGEWEPKGSYLDFESLGPKTYHAWLDGKEEIAAKGIPNPNWKNLKSGKVVGYKSMRGIRRARNGERFFEVLDSTRTVTPNTGRRIADPGGVLTLPPRLDED